jgi:hypothetical protein
MPTDRPYQNAPKNRCRLPKKLPTLGTELFFPLAKLLRCRCLRGLERVKGIEPSFRFISFKARFYGGF